MFKNLGPKSQFIIAFILVTFTHILVLIFVKKPDPNALLNENLFHQNLNNRIKVNNIELLKPEDVERFRTAGIKGGNKSIQNPDLKLMPQLPNLGPSGINYNLSQLAPQNIDVPKNKQPNSPSTPSENNKNSNLYFNFKKQRVIPPSVEHNNLKLETIKNLGVNRLNTRANNISNFDIRVERPEGVSEDQLNADEKAFYSFYKRTYSNYISKLYATFSKVRIEKPGLDQDFNDDHLLIGKIDYDENGDIVAIKILKSSSSDNVHYFFEEALKELKIPNPPKVFVKNQKQFSIYYQIKIN